MRILTLRFAIIFFAVLVLLVAFSVYALFSRANNISQAHNLSTTIQKPEKLNNGSLKIYREFRDEIVKFISQNNNKSARLAISNLKSRIIALGVFKNQQQQHLNRILALDRILQNQAFSANVINELDEIFDF